ncbi:hypothetical protein ACVWWG_009353 [Bradyrhizobium sp. LB7.2]
MAKVPPILTLFFQPRDEGAEQPMYVRGSRTQGQVLGDANLVGRRDGRASRSGATDIHRLVQLRPIQPQPCSESLSMSFWRKPTRRDEIGAAMTDRSARWEWVRFSFEGRRRAAPFSTHAEHRVVWIYVGLAEDIRPEASTCLSSGTIRASPRRSTPPRLRLRGERHAVDLVATEPGLSVPPEGSAVTRGLLPILARHAHGRRRNHRRTAAQAARLPLPAAQAT